MTPITAPARPLAPLGFTDGQLETLKWIALVSMFLDHFGRHLLGHGNDSWYFVLGRAAFPLFAFVLAVNLARDGDRAERAARTGQRLALWCAVAVVPSIAARGEPMLVNILGTLSLGAIICWTLASAARLPIRVAVLGIATAASWFVEYGLPGVFVIPATYLWCTERKREAAVLAVLLFLMTVRLNATFGGLPGLLGTLAAVPITLLVAQLPLRVPRLRLAFYLVYPAHLALIGVLKGTA